MIYNNVYNFLKGLNLIRYWDTFLAKGFDREDDLKNLDINDLDILLIEEQDKSPLLNAVAGYHISDDFHFLTWLEEHGLGHYHENLLQGDYTFTDILAATELTGDFFGEIEMDVPGHRKRLRRAVASLHKKRKKVQPEELEEPEEPEEPLAIGYWGKPSCLADSRNEFLCVRAAVESTKSHHNKQELEFMVDSGSDVITLREGILEDMDLEPLGVVHSVGIHASKEKQIYMANLWVGNVSIQVEVMAEKFDSIGNQTLKSFRHYIDPTRHIWLRTLAPRPADSEQTQLCLAVLDDELQSDSNIQDDAQVIDKNTAGDVEKHNKAEKKEEMDTGFTNSQDMSDEMISSAVEINQNDASKDDVIETEGAIT